MFDADFGYILLSFVVNLIGIVSQFLIFALRVEYSLQKLEGENNLLLGVVFHPEC